MLFLCAAVDAAQFGNFTYLDSGNAITITAYSPDAGGAVVIPQTIAGKPVRIIGEDAFFMRSKITSVTIPAGVTAIREDAFSYCSSLVTVNLPGTVTQIGYRAFGLCPKLANITLPTGVQTIASNAFERCEALKAVTLPSTLTSLEIASFQDSGLKSITVAAGNPSYSSAGGILYNKNKTTLIFCPPKWSGALAIPPSVTDIGAGAFYRCTLLESVSIPSGVKSIGSGAFHTCLKLPAIILPAGVTHIGDGAFAFCEGLTTFKIPSGVTAIGGNTFSHCSGLASVSIPTSVKSIGVGAFSNCLALKDLPIPAGVTSIGAFAFSQSGLRGITIPAAVTDIGQSAFVSCFGLLSIDVHPSNTTYRSISGVLYDKTGTILMQFPYGRSGKHVISHGTAIIDTEAFGYCPKVTEVMFPSTLMEIRESAFTGCNLTKVTFPANLASIGGGAFSFCPSLVEARFTGDAPAMGLGVFEYAADGFGIRYFSNHTGFTSPTWSGYPAAALGEEVVLPADIGVEIAGGAAFVNGGTCSAFGSVQVGGKSVVVLKIRNTGTLELTDLSLTKSGASAGEFQIVPLVSDYLAGSGFIPCKITFSPVASGTRSATIRITSNDGDESPFVLKLSATVTAPLAPEVGVMQPAGSKLADGKSKKSFGTVKTGAKSPAKTFTITNSGTAKLTGLSLTCTGTGAKDFILTQPGKTSLAPGASTNFKVTFKPTAKGTRSASLRLTSNDADENPFDIKLTGLGVR